MSPTPDETAAAEVRLRRLAAGEPFAAVWPGRTKWEAWSLDGLDRRTLADAYLADHPADSNEPVAGDWLTSVAHEPPAGDHEYWQWVYGDGQGRLCVWLRYGLWWCSVEEAGADRDSQLPQLTTRGQLRRLLAALGVPAAQGGAP